jgi:hypothetical protein
MGKQHSDGSQEDTLLEWEVFGTASGDWEMVGFGFGEFGFCYGIVS